jgi:hypothetical protein
MNVNELHAKLIAVARKNPPGDRVPYAFEKRIMSHLGAASPPNPWALWGRSLWRAAVSCVAITVLCGLWSYTSGRGTENADNFSQDFEAAVFAPVNEQFEDAW